MALILILFLIYPIISRSQAGEAVKVLSESLKNSRKSAVSY